MKDAVLKWKTKGQKTTIACFQTGEHFAIREMDNESGEVQLIGQTFSLVEAWEMYNATVSARVHKVLAEQDKARRPEDARAALSIQKGLGHVTDLQHPFIRQLYDDWRAGNCMKYGDAPTEDERREFDRMVVEFLHPDLPEAVKRTLKGKSPTDELFDRFWAAYPRKSNKKDAEKAFRAIKHISKIFPVILEDLEKRRQTAMWTEQNGQYVPYPATYLRGEQWKNELPEEVEAVTAQGKPLASGFAAEDAAEYERLVAQQRPVYRA